MTVEVVAVGIGAREPTQQQEERRPRKNMVPLFTKRSQQENTNRQEKRHSTQHAGCTQDVKVGGVRVGPGEPAVLSAAGPTLGQVCMLRCVLGPLAKRSGADAVACRQVLAARAASEGVDLSQLDGVLAYYVTYKAFVVNMRTGTLHGRWHLDDVRYVAERLANGERGLVSPA